MHSGIFYLKYLEFFVYASIYLCRKELNLKYNLHLSLFSQVVIRDLISRIYDPSYFSSNITLKIQTYTESPCICIRRVSHERIDRGHAACFLGSGLSHERALNYFSALKRHTRLKSSRTRHSFHSRYLSVRKYTVLRPVRL